MLDPAECTVCPGKLATGALQELVMPTPGVAFKGEPAESHCLAGAGEVGPWAGSVPLCPGIWGRSRGCRVPGTGELGTPAREGFVRMGEAGWSPGGICSCRPGTRGCRTASIGEADCLAAWAPGCRCLWAGQDFSGTSPPCVAEPNRSCGWGWCRGGESCHRAGATGQPRTVCVSTAACGSAGASSSVQAWERRPGTP